MEETDVQIGISDEAELRVNTRLAICRVAARDGMVFPWFGTCPILAESLRRQADNWTLAESPPLG